MTGASRNSHPLLSAATASSLTHPAVSVLHSTFPFTPTILKPNTTSFGSGAKIDIANNALVTGGTAAAALGMIQSGQIFLTTLEGTTAEMCMPGDNVKVTIELLPEMPIAMEENLRFAIREGGRTVGSGVVTKILQ